MNEGLAVHTAARRYCLQRHAFWAERYADLIQERRDRDGPGYSAEALDTFPRYNVLNAIRVEVERIDLAELADPGAVRRRVVRAGEEGEDDSTRKANGETDRMAWADERAKFVAFVRGLSAADLAAVEPLPFRRVLNADESHVIWGRLRERWRISDHYWYPLAECERSDVAAFDSDVFETAVPAGRLWAILADRGVARVWELREYGPEYESDLVLFGPRYDGAEGYWSSGDLEWIVYASHEGTVTVGGWLLGVVQAGWPAWHSGLWRRPA